MSTSSLKHVSDKSPSHDAFDLDRLAEELEQRELQYTHTNTATNGTSEREFPSDLPLPLTLTHDNPYLSSESFSIDDFLLSRSYTSLYDLRTELREYLAKLKEELVQLINDDYEAFLSLSTDLRGEGTRLERMRWPLEDMKAVMTTSRAELQTLLDAIHEKMERRAALREEKAFLHLLLKVSDSVARLESLLLIASPEQNRFDTSAPSSAISARADSDVSATDDRAARANRPKHLLRIATEFTQLLYHVDKARPCKFIDEIQWRVDRIKSTLSSDLESLFSKTVLAVTTSERAPTERLMFVDGDKAKHMSELLDCLKAYDMLGLWRDAEDVLRRDIVRSFIKKTVYSGCLSGPHSPVLPHTPLHQISSLDVIQPRTPFTPYTAFPMKQNSYGFGDAAASAYLLDDTDDPLASLYNKILRFVDRDLKMIMDAAEQFSGKRLQAKAFTDRRLLVTNNSLLDNEDNEEYMNIFVNVVWEEIARAIMEELGAVVFAAGKPDDFRRNYETTQSFLRSLEYLAPSISSIRRMRASSKYESFTRRWQLPIYFQLRWKDIVAKVEESIESASSLSSNGVVAKRADSSSAPFKLKPSATIWEAMCNCWSGNVYLPDLSHKFWRLTLQLVSRYHSWLSGCIQSLDSVPVVNDKPTSNTSVPSARSGTPISDAHNVAVDDVVLEQSALVLSDIKELEQKSMELWRLNIRDLLPSTLGLDEESTFEDIFKQAISAITDLIPSVSSRIVVILTRRCCDALAPVKSLPGQFRATSQKHMPSKASTFVSLILRPLKIFFAVGVGDGPGRSIKKWFGASIGLEVVEAVSSRYLAHLTAMKKTEESLRRLKVGKKAGFSFFGGGSSGDDDSRDEERVRRQLILDVDAFKKDAETLDIAIHSSPSFISLSSMVQEIPRADSVASSSVQV